MTTPKPTGRITAGAARADKAIRDRTYFLLVLIVVLGLFGGYLIQREQYSIQRTQHNSCLQSITILRHFNDTQRTLIEIQRDNLVITPAIRARYIAAYKASLNPIQLPSCPK